MQRPLLRHVMQSHPSRRLSPHGSHGPDPSAVLCRINRCLVQTADRVPSSCGNPTIDRHLQAVNSRWGRYPSSSTARSATTDVCMPFGFCHAIPFDKAAPEQSIAGRRFESVEGTYATLTIPRASRVHEVSVLVCESAGRIVPPSRRPWRRAGLVARSAVPSPVAAGVRARHARRGRAEDPRPARQVSATFPGASRPARQRRSATAGPQAGRRLWPRA